MFSLPQIPSRGPDRPAHRRWPLVLARALALTPVLSLCRCFPVAAAGVLLTSPANPSTQDLSTDIGRATAWVVKISAVVATFFLTLGGFRYMSAGSDPSEVERAKGSFRSAAVGYALCILAPVILLVLKSILGVSS